MNVKMVLEAIIFDLDGTIVNSPEVQWYAFNDYLKKFDVQISWADWVNKYLGEKSEAIWKAVSQENDLIINIDEAQRERRANYRSLVKKGKLKEIKGFTEFFKWLNSTFSPPIPIVIASNGHPSSIETSLKAIGYFDRIKYYSGEQGAFKISKQHLLSSVVKDLQLSPNHCLVFEDSSLGAAAAKKNGMTVIIINSSHLPKDNFETTSLIVDDYSVPTIFSYVKELYDSSMINYWYKKKEIHKQD
jgi:beta-phosphoglucomutase